MHAMSGKKTENMRTNMNVKSIHFAHPTQARIQRDRSAVLELSRLKFTDVWTLGTVSRKRSPRNALSESERRSAELLEIIFIHDHSCNKSVNFINILEMRRFFPRISRFFHSKYAHMQKNMHLHCPSYFIPLTSKMPS